MMRQALVSALIVAGVAGSAFAQSSLQDLLRPRPTAPAQQQPAPQPSAPQLGPTARLAGGPYGPDLMGVRLGMTFDEADAAIRQAIRVGRVLETLDPARDRAQDWTSRVRGRLYLSEDGKEQFAIFESRGEGAGRVLAGWHRSEVTHQSQGGSQANPGTREAIARRGRPDNGHNTSVKVYWGASSALSGICQSGGGPATWHLWLEGERTVPLPERHQAEDLAPNIPRAYPGGRQQVDSCGAVLEVMGHLHPPPRPGLPIPVTSRLFDVAVLGWLMSLPPPSPGVGAGPPSGPRLAREPYGPDVIGIRLGMPMEEAERLIRAHMNVGQVLDAPSQAHLSDDHVIAHAYLRGRLFIAANRHEHVAIFEAPSHVPGRVVWLIRGVYLPSPSWTDILADLTAKYGRPDRAESPPRSHWASWGGENHERSCDMKNRNSTSHAWQHWVWMDGNWRIPDGNHRVVPENLTLQDMVGIQVPWHQRQLRGRELSACGPVLAVDFNESGLVMTGQNQMATRIAFRLFDNSFMAWLLTQPRPSPPAAAPGSQPRVRL